MIGISKSSVIILDVVAIQPFEEVAVIITSISGLHARLVSTTSPTKRKSSSLFRICHRTSATPNVELESVAVEIS